MSTGTLDPKLLTIFIGELRLQCGHAFRSFASFEDALRRDDADTAFFTAHAFCNDMANVAKILKPSKPGPSGRYEYRAAIILDTLDIDPNLWILPRNLRNGLEHFDEDLDDWWVNNPSASFIDRNYGPPGMITVAGVVPTSARHLDPSTTEFSLFNRTPVNIRAAYVELRTIDKKAQAWQERHDAWGKPLTPSPV